jgi:hypothetical protein
MTSLCKISFIQKEKVSFLFLTNQLVLCLSCIWEMCCSFYVVILFSEYVKTQLCQNSYSLLNKWPPETSSLIWDVLWGPMTVYSGDCKGFTEPDRSRDCALPMPSKITELTKSHTCPGQGLEMHGFPPLTLLLDPQIVSSLVPHKCERIAPNGTHFQEIKH